MNVLFIRAGGFIEDEMCLDASFGRLYGSRCQYAKGARSTLWIKRRYATSHQVETCFCLLGVSRRIDWLPFSKPIQQRTNRPPSEPPRP